MFNWIYIRLVALILLLVSSVPFMIDLLNSRSDLGLIVSFVWPFVLIFLIVKTIMHINKKGTTT